MCRPLSRKAFSTEKQGGPRRATELRIQSASREAQSALCSVFSVVLTCFLRAENLVDVPPPRSPRRKTKGKRPDRTPTQFKRLSRHLGHAVFSSPWTRPQHTPWRSVVLARPPCETLFVLPSAHH